MDRKELERHIAEVYGTVEPTMLKWLVEMSHKNTKGL